ncbi:MAG: carotenoid biosynthesis protein [Cyclobacteriaceae bacterium]|nr:carotenoid biosynthesis protein [Cyclobacteriaceae bacterium]
MINNSPSVRVPQKYAIFLIVSMHLAGIIGLALPVSRELFLWLTPFNLIATFLLLIDSHSDWRNSFKVYLILAYVISFAVEAIGVNTGIIFGWYEYGTVLGYKLWGTPLLIGINWLILLLATGDVANRIHSNLLVRSALAAVFMVVLDFIIEPIAISLGFWTWEEVLVPLRNYAGWFITALILQVMYSLTNTNPRNSRSVWVLGAQILFFAILNFIL